LKIVDKYIFVTLLTTFIFGMVVFASVLLASEAFLDVVRQISKFGIPMKLALLVVALRLPGVIVYTIPMALLVSVILTYNRLNNNLEITAIRSVGVSLYRILIPSLIFGLFAAGVTLLLNEVIVPQANYQARNIMLWAITQKNIPRQAQNFVYKDLGKKNYLRRLFYIEKYENDKMHGVIVLDMTDEKTTKIIQAKEVDSQPNKWVFQNGKVYTVSNNGKITNTSSFATIVLKDPVTIDLTRKDPRSKEFNFFQLGRVIKEERQRKGDVSPTLVIKWHEKLSIPFACILIPLIGMPLALSPPRSKFNRGLGFSVGVIFIYYLIKALSMSLGEINIFPPLLAAWLPNVVILVLGLFLLQKKSYS
jgi:lipopolysaccharide export system permease protein